MTFAMMLAAAWMLPAPMAGAAPAAGMSAGVSDDAAAKQRVAAARSLCELAKEDLAAPGADPSDIAAQAESLGKDPKRIFAFVRDEIAYEPSRRNQMSDQ
jgi:hypothetical protein